jgi:hypothetical protein
MTTRWKTYEEVAAYLLNKFAEEFGLTRVEGQQTVSGKRSGTEWTIDAKGVRDGNEAFIIVECRRYTTTKQDQEKVGALAYRIMDTGADGGIIVSPMGLQSGAQKVAETEGIISIELYEDNTPTEFSLRFLNKLFVGIAETLKASDRSDAELVRKCDTCGNDFVVMQDKRKCPSCTENA